MLNVKSKLIEEKVILYTNFFPLFHENIFTGALANSEKKIRKKRNARLGSRKKNRRRAQPENLPDGIFLTAGTLRLSNIYLWLKSQSLNKKSWELVIGLFIFLLNLNQSGLFLLKLTHKHNYQEFLFFLALLIRKLRLRRKSW